MSNNSTSIKIFATIAALISGLGLLASVISLQFMSIFSYSMLCWGSIIGYQLGKYKLDNNESRKVMFAMIVTIGVSLIAFFLGSILGFVVSLITLATTFGIKKNYDDWNRRFPKEEEDIHDHLVG